MEEEIPPGHVPYPGCAKPNAPHFTDDQLRLIKMALWTFKDHLIDIDAGEFFTDDTQDEVDAILDAIYLASPKAVIK